MSLAVQVELRGRNSGKQQRAHAAVTVIHKGTRNTCGDVTRRKRDKDGTGSALG